jgi:hypothetical protein
MYARKLLLGGLVATAAIGSTLALAPSANADIISSDPNCVPQQAVSAWTEIEYKYVPVVSGTGSTHWAKNNGPAQITVDAVLYKRDGNKTRTIEHPAVPGVVCAVTLPWFESEYVDGEWTATVPVTPYVKTYLKGVPGYDENTPIEQFVAVKSEWVGGSQFWIEYKVDDGYVAANEASGTSTSTGPVPSRCPSSRP